MPEFALRAVDWVDAALRPRVLHAIDAFGYVRDDDWHPGAAESVPGKPTVALRRSTSGSGAPGTRPR